MEFTLSTNQQRLFNLVESSSDNLLIHGSPGVGKSVLINALTTGGKKFYHLAAPTGLAALNIQGKTLHSVFRLPVSQGIIAPDYDVYPTDDKVIGMLRGMKHLIIDEISMVRSDTFAYIDRLLKFARNTSQPFGGVQVVIVGDFYQLPPVVVGAENKAIREHFTTPFVFSTEVFKSFKIEFLNEVLRQKDDLRFIEILNEARTGLVTPKALREINERVSTSISDFRIRLTGINRQADETNQQFLRNIKEPEQTFEADEYGTWPAYPVENFLVLKVGAQVMVKKNRADVPPNARAVAASKVVNGTIGKVATMSDALVEIELADGCIVPIYRQTWERKVKEKVDGKWVEHVVASYSQIPLSLAWAISMHKSQGQSFDTVHIDPSRVFAPGQLYVALSRCRTLAGITLESRVNAQAFIANRDVTNFFEELT